MAPFKALAVALVTTLACSNIVGVAAVPVPGVLPHIAPNDNTKGDKVIHKLPKGGLPPHQYPKAIDTPTLHTPLKKLPPSKVPPKQDYHNMGPPPYNVGQGPFDPMDYADPKQFPKKEKPIEFDLWPSTQPNFNDARFYHLWDGDAKDGSGEDNDHEGNDHEGNGHEEHDQEDTDSFDHPARIEQLSRRDAGYPSSPIVYHTDPVYPDNTATTTLFRRESWASPADQYLGTLHKESERPKEEASKHLDMVHQKMETLGETMYNIRQEQGLNKSFPMPPAMYSIIVNLIKELEQLREPLVENLKKVQNQTGTLDAEMLKLQAQLKEH